MPKFEITYANLVVMKKVVEADSEAELPVFDVDADLQRAANEMPHVESVTDFDGVWEVDELAD